MFCNHYLTLEHVGMTCCIESITLSTSSVMTLDSMFRPSSTTDAYVNDTTTTTNEIDINTATIATNRMSNSIDIVNNNLMAWKEHSLVKGMQILIAKTISNIKITENVNPSMSETEKKHEMWKNMLKHRFHVIALSTCFMHPIELFCQPKMMKVTTSTPCTQHRMILMKNVKHVIY